MTAHEPLGPLLELASDPMGLVDDQGVVRYANASLIGALGADPVGHTVESTGVDPVATTPAPGLPGWTVCRFDDPEKALLRARSEVLAALVESAPVAILVLDLDKRITMWNPASERMFGWTAEEILGEAYPLVPPDDWDRFGRFFDTVVGGQGFTGVEGVRAGKNGKPVHVAISTAPIRGAGGKVTHAMAILEDISTRKQLEERYRQAQKMEAIGRLAGGIAHDFNNVLTVILAYTDAMLVTRDPNRVRSDAAAIQRAAERAADLTRQLLAFGRRQVLKAKQVDLNHTVSDSVEMLRRLIGEDVRIELDLDPNLGPVRADPTQLERMLMNLAANARDAMPQGGTFRISTERVDQSANPSLTDGRWVRLTVHDSGEGMDEQTIAHVFEPFFTTKELGRGTGLGLASVYGIVRQSGGQVDVQSVPAGGTAFQIYLPEATGPIDEAEPVEPTEQTLGTGNTVLVAEDDPQVREVIRRVLSNRGFDVHAAASGAEALALADAWDGPIDLLLTDVVMPGMSGRELATQLVRSRPGLRVIFVSGYTDDEVLKRGVERGAAFLHKPFTTTSLLEAIRAVLQS